MSVATFVIGIDLGNEEHSICIIAADGRVVKERVVDNDATTLRVIMDQIGDCPPQSVDVAVEDMRVALVDALLGYGFNVFTLSPKQLDRFRDRTSISGAKDDRRDAFVLASSLRSDRHLFRQAELLSPVVEREEDLVPDAREDPPLHRMRLCGAERDDAEGSGIPRSPPGLGDANNYISDARITPRSKPSRLMHPDSCSLKAGEPPSNSSCQRLTKHASSSRTWRMAPSR
jgi:hypothetical protein